MNRKLWWKFDPYLVDNWRTVRYQVTKKFFIDRIVHIEQTNTTSFIKGLGKSIDKAFSCFYWSTFWSICDCFVADKFSYLHSKVHSKVPVGVKSLVIFQQTYNPAEFTVVNNFQCITIYCQCCWNIEFYCPKLSVPWSREWYSGEYDWSYLVYW